MEDKGDSDVNKYIYLDFNDKLSSDVFQNDVFLRIANLNKKNPLVQVNDTLFQGTFDHSMGTNLFFEEADQPPNPGNVFEKQTPICLKHFQSSTKVLNLQQVKIPQSKAKIRNEIKNINYNLDWNYKELLEKLDNGTLQIEDISSGSEEIPPQKQDVEKDNIEEKDDSTNSEIASEIAIEPQPETEVELEKKLENACEDVTQSNMLMEEYEQLKILARRPVRRATSPESVAECDEKYKEAFEYHNIERQILQPRDGFKSEVLQINEDTLSDCVDIDRCILLGLIKESSDFSKVLSTEEKQKLLTLENFDNLSLAGRYYVLQNLVNDLQEYVNGATPNELHNKDEHGRTVVQTLDIYKKVTAALKNRLQELKSSV